MLLFAGIAFVGFWFYTVRLWVLDGRRLPLFFIALWGLALYGTISLGIKPHVFMGIEAVLALVLAIINGYRVPPLP
jgi:hypothetical protein